MRKRPKKSSPGQKAKRAERTSPKAKEPRERAYYPAFISLAGRPCVVVGGGRVAERKVSGLLKAGANKIKVISPDLTKGLARKKSAGLIKHIARQFTPPGLRGAFLVIAATDSEEQNLRIAKAAEDLDVPLVNVVDMPEHCGFIVPASVKRGPLTIAVSTSGSSPAMARAIREELEGLYGAAFGRYLKRLERGRQRALERIKEPKERERFLKSLASGRIFKTLRKGKQPRLRESRKK